MIICRVNEERKKGREKANRKAGRSEGDKEEKVPEA